MTKLTINVTREILERSANCISQKGRNCAIALAVRDIFPDAWVGEVTIDPFHDPKHSLISGYEIRMPVKATRFIKEFDIRYPEERAVMEPLSFDVFVSDDIIEKIDIEEVKKLLVDHPTLTLAE